MPNGRKSAYQRNTKYFLNVNLKIPKSDIEKNIPMTKANIHNYQTEKQKRN